jgi:hypothetical protein
MLGDGGRVDDVNEFVEGLSEAMGELEAFASPLVVERTRFGPDGVLENDGIGIVEGRVTIWVGPDEFVNGGINESAGRGWCAMGENARGGSVVKEQIEERPDLVNDTIGGGGHELLPIVEHGPFEDDGGDDAI